MHNDAESKILGEGGRSYVAAVNAVRAFRDIVWKRCREVVVNRLPEYIKALNWTPKEDAVRDWQTSDGNWDGVGAGLGTRLYFGRSNSLWHFVWWTGDAKKPVEVCAMVYLGTRKNAERFWDAIGGHDSRLGRWSGKEMGLSEPLTVEEFAQFDRRLDKQLVRWIEVWRKAGGLKRLLKDTEDVADEEE